MPAGEPATKPDPGEEQRKSHRALLLVQIEIGNTGDFSIGRGENISEGGLLVFTHNTFAPKTETITRFNLPSTPHECHIECPGVVVHVQPGAHMGVEFLQLKDEHRKAIAAFVQATLAGDK